jgi:hypothetical protein
VIAYFVKKGNDFFKSFAHSAVCEKAYKGHSLASV